MAPLIRALTLLCLALPAVHADEILRFHEERTFTKQLYAQFTGHASLLVGDLPGEGLVIHSLADPRHQAKVGEIPTTERTMGLAMFENRLLRLTAEGLLVYSLESPAEPELVFTVTLDKRLTQMKMMVVDNRVYVGGVPTRGPTEFLLFAAMLSVPSQSFVPVELRSPTGSIPGSQAWLIDNRGLYVLDGLNFWVFDMQDSLLAENGRLVEPGLEGYLPSLAFYQNKVVLNTGSFLYLYDPDDVSNTKTFPTALSRSSGSLVIGDYFLDFDLFGYAVYDFTRADNPWLGNNYVAYPSAVPLYDPARDLLFLPENGRCIVVENPVGMTDEGTTVTLRDGFPPFTNAASQGSLTAVVAPGRVGILQQSDGGGFEERASISLPAVSDLEWFGDYLLALQVEGTERPSLLYNLQDPQQPTLELRENISAYSRDGNRLARYKGPDMSVWVQDWEDPMNVKTLGRAAFPSGFEVTAKIRLLLSENLLFVLSDPQILVFDSSAGSYQLVAEFEVSLNLRPKAMVRVGDQLILGGNDVTAYDISDPSQPQRRGSWRAYGQSPTRERFAGAVGRTVVFLRDQYLTVVDVSDPDNLRWVPFDPGGEVRFVRIEDGLMLAGLSEPERLVSGPAVLCTPPEITAMPVDTLLCADETVTLSTVVAGEGLVYQWYRDGELLEGANAAELAVSDLQQTRSYLCRVSSACAEVETEVVQVMPTICRLDQAYSVWRSDGYFCEIQNPTVLTFTASLNDGGGCVP